MSSPPPAWTGRARLPRFWSSAQRLTKARDPKLDATVEVLKPLMAEGANPVVFCRFIATAEHVAAGLRKAFPKLRIDAVTGALTPEERRARVEDMARSGTASAGSHRLPV